MASRPLTSQSPAILAIGVLAVAIYAGWLLVFRLLWTPNLSQESFALIFFRSSNLGQVVGATILLLVIGWILAKDRGKPTWMYLVLVAFQAIAVVASMASAYVFASFVAGGPPRTLDTTAINTATLAGSLATAGVLFLLLVLALPRSGGPRLASTPFAAPESRDPPTPPPWAP